jgi:uncharacterized protein (TIGR02452 family)
MSTINEQFTINNVYNHLDETKKPSASIGNLIHTIQQFKGHEKNSEIQAIHSIAELLYNTDTLSTEGKNLSDVIRTWKGYDSLPFSVRARLRLSSIEKTQRSTWKTLGIWIEEAFTSMKRAIFGGNTTKSAFLTTALKEEVLHAQNAQNTDTSQPKTSSSVENPKPPSQEELSHLPSHDVATFKNNLKKMNLNQALKPIVEQTRDLYHKGAYQTEGTVVLLDKDLMKKTQENTVVYNASETPPIPPSQKTPGLVTQVTVENTDTVTATRHVMDKGAKKPVLLNLANAYSAGGGVLTGCTAQEEELCRCSTLLHAIGENERLAALPPEGSAYVYKQPIPQGGVVYSPNVQFFRGTRAEGYPLWKTPMQAGVISAAGPDLRTKSKESAISLTEYKKIVTTTIESILRVAAANHHDAVVLGAIGCGAFRNPDWEKKQLTDKNGPKTIPELVSSLFKEVLEKDEFKEVFKEISFGIFDQTPKKEVISPFVTTFQIA